MKTSDVLTVGYRYSEESVPFLKKLHGYNSLTLIQFKQLIPKRNGPHTYYFRKECNEFGTGYVMEEICDDNELLPVNEGNKIYGVIESVSRH
ncbi:axin-1-like protein [Leptotrombidium deliense]|uniref:Axin-1-like protein n=1 Tax=Leptotrombidium deliense TaxID=299467 RepID=A0A443SA68_9ACAR|nr:axin-1-like protein [Leptotrombidium deliense]